MRADSQFHPVDDCLTDTFAGIEPVAGKSVLLGVGSSAEEMQRTNRTIEYTLSLAMTVHKHANVLLTSDGVERTF